MPDSNDAVDGARVYFEDDCGLGAPVLPQPASLWCGGVDGTALLVASRSIRQEHEAPSIV